MRKTLRRLAALLPALLLALNACALATGANGAPQTADAGNWLKAAEAAVGEQVAPEDGGWTLRGLPVQPTPEPATPEPAAPDPTATPEPATPERAVKLQEGSLNVRAGAGMGEEILTRLVNGDVVELLGMADERWANVRLADGTQGYVDSQYLAEIEPPEPVEPEPVEPEPAAEAEAAAPEAPAAPEEAGSTHIVKLQEGTLNFREAPSMDAKVIAALFDGTELELLDMADERWANVRLTDGRVGYVDSQFLVEGEPPEGPASKRIVMIREGTLNFRDAAGMDGKVIDNFVNGAVVRLLGMADERWANIRAADGRVGYVDSQYLGMPPELAEPAAPTEPAAPAEEAAEPAEPTSLAEPAAPVEAPGEPDEPAAPEDTKAPGEIPVMTLEYEREADNSLMLNGNGDPMPALPMSAQMRPVAYLRDRYGELVLDASDNPIPRQYVPVEAKKIYTVQDALDRERRIEIYADFDGDVLYYGQELRLTAVPQHYDNFTYSLQWQHSADGAAWEDIPGATEITYGFVVDEQNRGDCWRVELCITGIAGAN